MPTSPLAVPLGGLPSKSSNRKLIKEMLLSNSCPIMSNVIQESTPECSEWQLAPLEAIGRHNPSSRLKELRERLATLQNDELVDSYLEWVKTPSWVILQNVKDETKFKAVKATKRGDNRYFNRTMDRWENVEARVSKLAVRCGHRETQALLATFTYSSQTEKNWQAISEDFNLTITRLRKQYGAIQVIRVWESHKSGLPHVHAIFIFEDQSFLVFKDKKGKDRVQHKEQLAKSWTYGFSDWQGVYDLKGALGYLGKYLSKFLSYQLPHATLNLAKLWIHRKRTFSISRRLDFTNCVIQTVLDGQRIECQEKQAPQWRKSCVITTKLNLYQFEILDLKESADYETVYRLILMPIQAKSGGTPNATLQT